MKRISVTLFFLAVLTGTMLGGRVVRDSIYSKTLGASIPFNVYLPDGFGKTTSAQYPVLYLLHGLTDSETAWVEKGQMNVVVDELIQTGEVKPLVVIMPCAGGPQRGVWNGYFDMPGWNYEQFFFSELMPTAEKKYNIVSDKQHRAVSGLSMGGGGSLSYAQHHPELFSSCYAMSAWLGAEAPDSSKVFDKKMYYLTRSVHDHDCTNFLRQADDKVREQLRGVAWFLDCGDDDFLLEPDEAFYNAMRRSRIPCEFRVRNGGHTWEYWHQALRLSLPFASRNFGK